MASDALTESAMLDSLEPRWVKEGYRVIRRPKPHELPAFLQGFQPDAIAIGSQPSLLIEILRHRGRSGDTKVRQLQGLLAGHPEWRLEVVYAAQEGVAVAPTTEAEVRAALDEARRVAEVAPRSALLLAWSIFEAVARRLEPDLAARSLSPGSLIDVMISTGRLPQTEAHFLREMAGGRNAAAHGLLDYRPTEGDVDRLIDLSEALSREQTALA
ncbi:hypothetical protein [uncultured Caulobacter sp.]|uniref:hypothetical protein n=1 Tax=uncultured Caulobacter sp. TaxID=158749 RepID=UPI002625294E|nr:hypothetical protein [uncultured Caulobacter sp.]